MRARIDAIYKRGKLRLLKPVSLAKGTQVEVVILANEDDRNEQNYLDILSEAAVSIEHDLKSPLGIMEMDILTLKRNDQAALDIARELESLEKQRRRIFEIVNVISFMRVQGDLAHSRFERIRVRELLHTAIRAIKGNLNDEEIRFQVSGDGLFTNADCRMLAQGISSLIQNFVDAI
jgi:K+-sensing histidine kinase KdpD